MGVIIHDDIVYGGGGSSDVENIMLTVAEYNALSYAEKHDPNKYYYVTDMNPGGYELPVASADTLGGVKVGSGLEIDSTTQKLSLSMSWRGIIDYNYSRTFDTGINPTGGNNVFGSISIDLSTMPVALDQFKKGAIVSGMTADNDYLLFILLSSQIYNVNTEHPTLMISYKCLNISSSQQSITKITLDVQYYK